MRALWRKLCGLALGVALLPSLAGGGACLEHAVHALSGAVSTAAAERDAHAGHGASVVSQASDAHAHYQTAVVASLIDAPTSDCCPPSGSPEHCAGAAGCSVSPIAVAANHAVHIEIASQVAPTTGALALPGPSRTPDVPPPRA